ncbi:hypothetical protein EPUS_09144 [Endocarpon pusillum Z07020]|uniref:GPI transamidase component GAA1 n=1 Tax=Endocarpon pusillum (strain Z07020 / HMAS-L-300199) TaxID=1263415 RepID=U1GH74_ENDPU|nr:uncharacterized protein EPUS_09144 [Endocarpon pusillum Z07020]ERF71121.1 hypothetical protein EPUS_09144 [Endocarpon pusillum Z07020]
MHTVTSLRRLRSHPRLHKIPPYISLLCIVGGIIWLLLLPLNRYSRQTYISENALLPGQVHTYFAGSEQNIFRGYREELKSVIKESEEARPQHLNEAHSSRENNVLWIDKIRAIFKTAGLPTATQDFEYHAAGNLSSGTNIYSVLHAPRGDGTEAIVLLAPQQNARGEHNINGIALLLTLARYFKRWSLWSKDIIFLITPDTDGGPQAWISAYHSTHDPQTIESLPLKSGALQGAICVDLPFDRRFEKISISYDGINGQLPNLDLVNTAVSVASGQMGIGTTIQGMHRHDDSYRARLITMLQGMTSQAVGHGTGAHSVFMPYHIDAITLTAAGDGWQDEMALGRTVESIFRSLNNLLEHFHQSFFFYLLMQANRFVSIGTYLPSAMAVAAGFSIMAIHLWIRSGHVEILSELPGQCINAEADLAEKPSLEADGLAHPPPNQQTQHIDRQLLKPILLILLAHLSGLIPLYLSHHTTYSHLPQTSLFTSFILLILPTLISPLSTPLPAQQYNLTKSLSLLLLGLSLSALATLNFSLSLALGLLCTPILFATRDRSIPGYLSRVILMVISPMGLWLLAYTYFAFWVGNPGWAGDVLARMAFGWNVLGAWGVGVGIWGVWWPGWVVVARVWL